MIRKGANQAGGSALTGDWQPMQAAPQPEPEQTPTPAAESQQPPARSVVYTALEHLAGIYPVISCAHLQQAM